MVDRMKHWIGIGWACVLVAVCSFSCVDDKEEEGQSDIVTVGDILPDFSVTMNDGRVLGRDGLQGAPTVILFFNTSCEDCRKELPVVQKLYENYGMDGRVVFVAISREQGRESVQRYWAENGLSLPYSAQADRKVYNLFARTAIPRLYVVDAGLAVRAVFTDSPLATYEDVAGELDKVL